MNSSEMWTDLEIRTLEGHRARVCLIYTGGTIGSVPTDSDDPTGPGYHPAPLEALMERVPWLGEEDRIELGLVSLREPVDSSAVTKEHWSAIAGVIQEQYDGFDGFVVLHGTDTMAFTASALSFLLHNLAKPVVITGSQRPIRDRRSDAVMNLVSAVQIAGYRATGLPCVPEVSLCFMDRLLRGNRATKVSAEKWQGFESPNYPSLGTIGERIKIRRELLLPAPDPVRRPFFADLELADEIKIIYVTPALTPQQFERDLRTEGLQGVILLTYGAGNFPASEAFLGPLREAVSGTGGFPRPLPVLNITQCLEGTVEMRRYEASSGLFEAGVASGVDMTLEAGLAKMTWALARGQREDVRAQLQISQAGEQGGNLFDLHFTAPREQGPERPQEIVEPSAQRLSSGFSQDRPSAATLRVQGLGMVAEDQAPPSLRVFLNRPGAGRETPCKGPHFVGEYSMERFSKDGVLVTVLSPAAQAMVDTGPTTVTLVGIRGRLWCSSVHVAFYTEAS